MAKSKLLSGNFCLFTAAPPINSASTQEIPEKDTVSRGLTTAVSEYFPMIKRGFIGEEEEGPEVVAVGWKQDVASRKDREEGLR